MLVIPEIKIIEIIDVILAVVADDYNSTTDKNRTLLYQLFGDTQIGKYNFYKEAVDIFTRGTEHQRRIQTRMMFDAQRAHLPTIHITMPSEQPNGDGIGFDQGYIEDTIDNENRTVTPMFTRMFDTNYHAVITSDNALEVICIYHVIKGLLISTFSNIEFNGIRNPKFSGQDLQIQMDNMPPHIFVRGLGISCSYETTVPSFDKEKFINKFKTIFTIIPGD